MSGSSPRSRIRPVQAAVRQAGGARVDTASPEAARGPRGPGRNVFRSGLVLSLVLCASTVLAADPWQVPQGPHKCPILRMDTGAVAPVLDRLPSWTGIVAEPPTTESAPVLMVDPPTRAGFAGPERFVCCSQGSADQESCEVTDLRTGVTQSVDLDPDAPEPDWLAALDDRPVWPFPGLEVHWTEALNDASVQSRASLLHPDSGTTQALDAVWAPEDGSLKLWGVRTAPDASRFALIRHLYAGEGSDIYPVTLFAANGPVRALYEQVVQCRGDRAGDAGRMVRALAGSTSPPSD